MGIIFTLILGAIATMGIWKLLPAARSQPLGRLLAGGAIGAIAIAWIVGSLARQASFVTNPPGPLTLLAAFIGGGIGAFVATMVPARED